MLHTSSSSDSSPSAESPEVRCDLVIRPLLLYLRLLVDVIVDAPPSSPDQVKSNIVYRIIRSELSIIMSLIKNHSIL